MKKLFVILAISTLLVVPAMAQKTESGKKVEPKTTVKSVTKTAPAPVKFTTCMTTGKKLGTMGKPLMVTYKGQEYPLCCAGCKAPFEKDPEKYIKAAMAKMKPAPTAKNTAKPTGKKS
jgi:YHS domain-containing protein